MNIEEKKDTMKNLKDEIEGIDEFVEYFLDGVDCLVNLDSMDYESEKMLRAGAKRELASLIEQEREKAVREFVDWSYKNTTLPNIMDNKEWQDYFKEETSRRVEQFLKESEGQDDNK